MQNAMEDDDFLDRLVFSDKVTFYLNGTVNRHNVRIWSTDQPLAIVEHESDSPKLNIFCAISKTKVIFFMDKTVTGISYLDMTQLWLFLQLQHQ